MRYVAIVGALLVLPVTLVAADPWRDGMYRIEASLQLPNIAATTSLRTVERCLIRSASGLPSFTILSNEFIAACPSRTEPHLTGVRVRFACGAPHGGEAAGTFNIAVNGFTGRIEVKSGGKNMTMTEIQTGTRLGDCRH